MGSEPGAPQGGRTWLSTVVSGAGKLFSAVFGSESPSRSEGEDEDENEETLVFLKEVDLENWDRKHLEVVKDCIEGSLALVSKIEPKDAIEKLVMQETFSREELSKFVKIIESRVIEPSISEVRNGGKSLEFLDGYGKPDFRLGCCCKMHSSQLNGNTVSEAQAQLEEKNSDARSKIGDLEGGLLSPVQVARNFMQSLHHSRPLVDIAASTVDPSEMHLHRHDTSRAGASSLPSFKDFKRKSLAFRSQESLKGTQRDRHKLRDFYLDLSSNELYDSYFKFLGHEPLYTSSEAITRDHADVGISGGSIVFQDTSINTSSIFTAKVPAEGCHVDESLRLPDGRCQKTILESKYTRGVATSSDLAYDNEKATPLKVSPRGDSGLEHANILQDFNSELHDSPTVSHENKDAEETVNVTEVGKGLPSDSCVLALPSGEHGKKRLRRSKGRAWGRRYRSTKNITTDTFSMPTVKRRRLLLLDLDDE